jgi:hypothetical protein
VDVAVAEYVVCAAENAGLNPDASLEGGGRGGSDGCDELLDTPGGPGYDMMNLTAL